MGVPQSVTPAPPPAQATAAPEIISPVVITGNAAPQPAAVTEMVPAPAPVSPPSPPSLPPPSPPPAVAPSPPTPLAASTAAAQPQDNNIVRGFAKSVPLAVALRQILPTGYAFSIDQDVDMGTLVSFRGGHPWRDTLRDALEPVGLVVREQGQMVAIGYPTRLPAPAAPITSASVTPAPAAASGMNYQLGAQPKSLAIPSAPSILSAPEPAPPDAISEPLPLPENWTAERGQGLRKVLDEWSQRSHVEFDWLSEYDYPLQASVSFTGSFENAVRSLLTGFEGAHPQPVAELHSNPNLGQMVLVVQTRGNTNSD
jgi:hypothetical protein